MQTNTSSQVRIVRILTSTVVIIGFWMEVAQGKVEAPVVIEEITGISAPFSPGERPKIAATIAAAPQAVQRGRAIEVTIIAAVTRPDHELQSWQWKNVLFAPGERKSFSLPKEYSITAVGTYRIAFTVYSSDMEKQFSSRSLTFTVAAPGSPRPAEALTTRAGKKNRAAGQTELQREGRRTYLAVGVTGNVVNPAGGVTILAWPLPQVGLQGTYVVGSFTSREVCILGRYEGSSWFNPYLGIGWLQVTKKAKVIGVETTFSSGAPTAHVGIEIPLGRRLIGYVEVIGTTMRLRKEVLTATEVATASVTYVPVSVQASIVVSLF
jgi:hypothetical protein